MHRERIELNVRDGTKMAAYTSRPDEEPSRPGVMVFQEAYGVNAHIRDVTDRFAREGYVAIAPDLFHRTAPGFEGPYGDFETVRPHVSALKNETMEGDIRASYDWLRSHCNGSVVSVGFCMGGRVSFLANSIVSLRASASFYGGGIAAGLLDRTPRLQAPMLFFWGGLDKHILPDDIRKVTDAMRASNRKFINVEISDADHGFFCDMRPSYNAIASMLSWGLVTDFFTQHLK
ncbi:MAG TPA: dienelactone hydrolase family protein [Bacteroidota bacterium]|nr:dienelactone hydrolase family protein [Bacteroidota bacterium]